MTMFTLSIPGSSANIGPGFDSMGIALNRYLTLEVMESANWELIHNSSFLPNYAHYEDHLIYKVAKQTAQKYKKSLQPCTIVMTSDIPLARGLGSSASAVVAGIELANQLCCLSLTAQEKLREATILEGHPDNVAPTIFGGCVISVASSDYTVDFMNIHDLDLDLILYIPHSELNTEEARQALPAHFSYEEAVRASSVSNLMIAALLQGNYKLSGEMMEKDLFHEPYRAQLIPYYETIKKAAKQYGAYGTVISGAGPTMISFVPKEKGESISKQMKNHLPNHSVETVSIVKQGMRINSD